MKRFDQFLIAGFALTLIPRAASSFIVNDTKIGIARASMLPGLVCLCVGTILWWRSRDAAEREAPKPAKKGKR